MSIKNFFRPNQSADLIFVKFVLAFFTCMFLVIVSMTIVIASSCGSSSDRQLKREQAAAQLSSDFSGKQVAGVSRDQSNKVTIHFTDGSTISARAGKYSLHVTQYVSQQK